MGTGEFNAGGQGGLEALPMIQCVKVRANFHRCKQNLVIIQGKSQVFTWLLLRFGLLLWPQGWLYLLFML